MQRRALITAILLALCSSSVCGSSLLQRTKHIFAPRSALAKTKSCTSASSKVAAIATTDEAATSTVQQECRQLLQGYDLLGNILGGQGHSWVLPYLRILTFSSRPVDEVKQLARKISASGAQRRQELKELRKLSPDVSAKFVAPPAERDNPFGKAIGNVMAFSIIGDLIDRSNDFDLNWVLIQMSTTRMIAATAKAMVSFEVNEERKKWLKEVAKEYTDIRNELREVIKLYIRGEGSASGEVRRDVKQKKDG